MKTLHWYLVRQEHVDAFLKAQCKEGGAVYVVRRTILPEGEPVHVYKVETEESARLLKSDYESPTA
jgi:hypothetical protein